MVFQITERLLDRGPLVLALDGRLDTVSAPELRQRLRTLVAQGRTHIVIDLSGVPFISGSGLAALISGLKAAREAGGTIQLVGLKEQAQAAFAVTLLDRVFDSYPDVDSAVGALKGEG
ncbi:MAG: STAS domain-containing protein [Anaerolineae bacterium]|jgi:anti-sigma B factor antagonist